MHGFTLDYSITLKTRKGILQLISRSYFEARINMDDEGKMEKRFWCLIPVLNSYS